MPRNKRVASGCLSGCPAHLELLDAAVHIAVCRRPDGGPDGVDSVWLGWIWRSARRRLAEAQATYPCAGALEIRESTHADVQKSLQKASLALKDMKASPCQKRTKRGDP